MARYGMAVTVQGSMKEVRGKVAEALKAQGFGILTEIDVQKALKEKIGVDFEPYLILGACSPGLAHQALTADRSIGLLLPCNVVLRDTGEAVEVSILDPEAMFEMVEPEARSALAGLPAEAKSRLRKALAALK
ncbi:MAG: DUF302 domain-containing protein [bacterium]